MDATKILPRMYVIGSDGECVGTVDRVADSRIQLARSNPAALSRQISVDTAHSVEGDRVWLVCPSTDVLSNVSGERADYRGQAPSA